MFLLKIVGDVAFPEQKQNRSGLGDRGRGDWRGGIEGEEKEAPTTRM